MSIRITYRNNFFYYLMMPGLWISGVLIYLGFGTVYLVYIVVKLAVILGAHSAVRWDEPLYRIRRCAPLAWLVERTISTPATHWAHHALTNADGIGHYKGNFGNLLFFWDVLFGTAKITRRYPAAVGLQDDLMLRQGALVRRDVLSAAAFAAHALDAAAGRTAVRRRGRRLRRRRLAVRSLLVNPPWSAPNRWPGS